MAEFAQIINLVKLDMLGVEPYVEGRIGELIDCQQYGLEVDDFEVAMEALSYCVLHIAKVNAVSPEAFAGIFETTLIKAEFQEAFFGAVKGSIAEMREIMLQENNRG